MSKKSEKILSEKTVVENSVSEKTVVENNKKIEEVNNEKSSLKTENLKKSENLKKTISPPKKRANETVVVAANLPHGQCFILSKGRRINIKGNAESIKGQRRGVIPVGAYGFTELKSEDWQEVLKLYGEMDIFKNGLVFSSDKHSEAKAEAEGLKSLRHGLEPVDSKKTATKSIEEEQ